MGKSNQEEIDTGSYSKNIKEKLDKNIENIDTASGKIVVEDGINFIKLLKEEAKRQRDAKKAELVSTLIPTGVAPIVSTDPELDRLADSFEILEEDDE